LSEDVVSWSFVLSLCVQWINPHQCWLSCKVQ